MVYNRSLFPAARHVMPLHPFYARLLPHPHTTITANTAPIGTPATAREPSIIPSAHPRPGSARTRSPAPLVDEARVPAHPPGPGHVRAVLLVLGADRRPVRAGAPAAVAFRRLGAVVDGGALAHGWCRGGMGEWVNGCGSWGCGGGGGWC